MLSLGSNQLYLGDNAQRRVEPGTDTPKTRRKSASHSMQIASTGDGPRQSGSIAASHWAHGRRTPGCGAHSSETRVRTRDRDVLQSGSCPETGHWRQGAGSGRQRPNPVEPAWPWATIKARADVVEARRTGNATGTAFGCQCCKLGEREYLGPERPGTSLGVYPVRSENGVQQAHTAKGPPERTGPCGVGSGTRLRRARC